MSSLPTWINMPGKLPSLWESITKPLIYSFSFEFHLKWEILNRSRPSPVLILFYLFIDDSYNCGESISRERKQRQWCNSNILICNSCQGFWRIISYLKAPTLFINLKDIPFRTIRKLRITWINNLCCFF